MSEIAKVLKEVAEKVGKALGHDASQAEHRLLHDTGDRLEANVKSHVEHDAEAAVALERAAKGDAENIRMPHGESGEPTLPHGEAGPSTSKPPELPGAGREPFPGETDLPNPREPVSGEQHPYLREPTQDREAEAIPGRKPADDAYVDGDPGGRDLPSEHEMSTFTGPVRPSTLEPGTTYYRSVGDGAYPNGSFWSAHPPNGETELRSGYAVKNSWNGDHGIVTFTPNHPVEVWEGEVGPQFATGTEDYYLPGGARQILVRRGTLGEDDGDWTIAPAPERSDP